MSMWALTFLLLSASGSAARGAMRPASPPARLSLHSGLPAAPARTQETDVPEGWVTLEEFKGLPVREYRELHPGSGRLAVIGLRTEAGVSHGPEWSFWPNGAPRIQRVWEQGRLNGPYKAWFKSGMPRLEGEMKADGREGTWRRFAEAGHLAAVSVYKDSLPHGTFWEYYGSGKNKSERQFEEGLQHGVERRWHGSGRLDFEAHWKAGIKHGPWMLRARNVGPPGTQGTFEDGVKVGVWREVNKADVTVSEVTYVAGEMHGTRKTWRDDGTLATEGTWVEGKETGPFTAYYEDGQKQMSGGKVDGKREGYWTYWKPDGSVQPAFTGTYANDVRVSD